MRLQDSIMLSGKQDNQPEFISKRCRRIKPRASASELFGMLKKNLFQDDNQQIDNYQNYKRIETKLNNQKKAEENTHLQKCKTFIVDDFEVQDQSIKELEQQIFFTVEQDQEQKQVITSVTIPEPEINLLSITYNSFYSLVSSCKLLSESRDLLNKLIDFPQTELRIFRKRQNFSQMYILQAIDLSKLYQKRFLMSISKSVSLRETVYEASVCISFPDHVRGTEYEVGNMVSDFVRNKYQIRNRQNSRKVTVIFDDGILHSRQVKLYVTYGTNESSFQYKNIPLKSRVKCDRSMGNSKRNIIIGPVSSSQTTNLQDFILILKKISLNGFSLTIGKQLTPLEAFCFSVAHLDRHS